MWFARECKKKMLDKGLTLKDIPGASKASWSKWMRDPYSVRLIDLFLLMEYLGFSLEEEKQIIEKLIKESHEDHIRNDR